jgi:enoyl-CoA hydratase
MSASAPADEILLAIDHRVARITLNRPDALNAENVAWVERLEAAVEAIASNPDVRVAVIQGAGRAFCAGLDLNMLAAEGMPDGFYAGQERAFRKLETLAPITIAAIHGYCLGGGVQLAIACDLRVAASDAQLGLPAMREGLFPGMAVHRLPRLIGLGPARRLILSGELLGADAAHAIGLVDHVVEAERFAAGVEEQVGLYRAAPAEAVRASKQLVDRAFDAELDDVYKQSLPLLDRCLSSEAAASAADEWRRRAGG